MNLREYTRNDLDKRYREAVASIAAIVSPFGEVEGPEDRKARVDRARNDKVFFKRTYFAHYARQAEPEFRPKIEEVLDARNEPQLLLGFRGCAKSTDVSLVDTAHEILYGTAHFFIFVSRSEGMAEAEYTIPLKAELEHNPRILNDFGNVGVQGEQGDFIANNIRVLALGLTQSFRGKKHGAWRPDRIRIEDIEDSNNRFKPEMIKKRMTAIHNDLLESVGSGIDEQWSVIYLANYFSKRSLIHAIRTSGRWNVTILKALRSDASGKEVSTWPERYPTAMLLEKRRKAPSTFSTEWQQEPTDDESAFRREWFHYYKPSEVPPDTVRCAWIDPSPGEKDTSDYKAYGVADFHLTPNGELHCYLRDVRVRKETVNEMIAGVYEMHLRWPGITEWGYEEIGSEAYLQQIIERDGPKHGSVLPLWPVMKNMPGFPFKKDRIPQMQSVLERGWVHVLQGDDDHERVIQHYLDFPDGLHDDGADMHSGLFKLGESQTMGQNILVQI